MPEHREQSIRRYRLVAEKTSTNTYSISYREPEPADDPATIVNDLRARAQTLARVGLQACLRADGDHLELYTLVETSRVSPPEPDIRIGAIDRASDMIGRTITVMTEPTKASRKARPRKSGKRSR